MNSSSIEQDEEESVVSNRKTTQSVNNQNNSLENKLDQQRLNSEYNNSAETRLQQLNFNNNVSTINDSKIPLDQQDPKILEFSDLRQGDLKRKSIGNILNKTDMILQDSQSEDVQWTSTNLYILAQQDKKSTDYVQQGISQEYTIPKNKSDMANKMSKQFIQMTPGTNKRHSRQSFGGQNRISVFKSPNGNRKGTYNQQIKQLDLNKKNKNASNFNDKNQQQQEQQTFQDFWMTFFFVVRFLYNMKYILLFRRPHNLSKIQLKLIGDKAAKGIEDGWGQREWSIRMYNKKGVSEKQKNIFWRMWQKVSLGIKCCCGKKDQFEALKNKERQEILKNLMANQGHTFERGQKRNMSNLFSNQHLRDYFKKVMVKIPIFQHKIVVLETIYIPFMYLNEFYECQYASDRQFNIRDNFRLYDIIATTIIGIDIIINANTDLHSEDQKSHSGRYSHYRLYFNIWIWLGLEQKKNNDQNWISSDQEFNNSTCPEIYLISFYYVVITINTVGYGDISPVTNKERLLIIFITLFSGANYAYTINKIGNLLNDLNEKNQKYKQKLANLHQYCKGHNVPSKLVMQAQQYLEYNQEEDDIDYQNNPKIKLKDLSQQLQDRILYQVNSQVVSEIKIFRNNFSEDFLDQIIDIVEEHVYNQNDYIIPPLNINNNQNIHNQKTIEPKIIYVGSGYVEVCLQSQFQNPQQLVSKQLYSLQKGEHIGEIEFLLNQQNSTYSLQAKEYTRIFTINRNKFVKILEQFSVEKEKFCTLRDNILYNQDYRWADQRCISCKQVSHIVKDCPYLFYKISQKETIRISNHNQCRRLRDFKRDNYRRKYNALENMEDIFDVVEEFLIENESNLNFDLEEFYRNQDMISMQNFDPSKNIQSINNQHRDSQVYTQEINLLNRNLKTQKSLLSRLDSQHRNSTHGLQQQANAYTSNNIESYTQSQNTMQNYNFHSDNFNVGQEYEDGSVQSDVSSSPIDLKSNHIKRKNTQNTIISRFRGDYRDNTILSQNSMNILQPTNRQQTYIEDEYGGYYFSPSQKTNQFNFEGVRPKSPTSQYRKNSHYTLKRKTEKQLSRKTTRRKCTTKIEKITQNQKIQQKNFNLKLQKTLQSYSHSNMVVDSQQQVNTTNYPSNESIINILKNQMGRNQDKGLNLNKNFNAQLSQPLSKMQSDLPFINVTLNTNQLNIDNDLQEWHRYWINIACFDKVRNFSLYFQHNNIEHLVTEAQKSRGVSLSKSVKSRLGTQNSIKNKLSMKSSQRKTNRSIANSLKQDVQQQYNNGNNNNNNNCGSHHQLREETMVEQIIYPKGFINFYNNMDDYWMECDSGLYPDQQDLSQA